MKACPKNGRRFSEEELSLMRQLHKEGCSYSEIGAVLKCRAGSVQYHLDPKKREDSHRRTKERRKKLHWLDQKCQSAISSSRSNGKSFGYAPCNATPKELKRAWTGRCCLCHKKHEESKLVVDHDHSDGRFRGWVCIPCNATLAKVDNVPSFLQRLTTHVNQTETLTRS